LAAQLELVGASFEFVSSDDVLAAVDGVRTLPERACLVTFDDGLRCQVDHALPVLERLGVPAVFFVPGLPLAEGRVLSVHKLHHIRERLADDDLAAELERAGVAVEDVDEDAARAHYRYDTPTAARLKFLLNVVLPTDRREQILGAIFARLEGDERAFADTLYMSSDDVRELGRRHGVGAHSYAHRPLARLEASARRRDLEQSTAVLEPLLDSRPRAFSYPHGTPSTVDVATARDAAMAGFSVAFTMERALNTTLVEPCLLARLDANDAPGGARPLLDLDGRRRYFDEAAVR